MKKIKIIFLSLLLFSGCFGFNAFACGLSGCSGGTLVSGTGDCTGSEPSVYDCGGYMQVISASLPGGGCAGAHRDCSSAPQM